MYSVVAMADGIRINSFQLAAGEKQEIGILLDNSSDYGGLQFDLYLPDGVTIVKNADDEYCDVTDRLKISSKSYMTCEFGRPDANEPNHWRCLIYNTSDKNIQGTSGDPIINIILSASDEITTGENNIEVKSQILSTVEATETKPADATYTCTLLINATVSSLGYATFSWPKALDFTGCTGVQPYIASALGNGTITMTPVSKVPANTGILLKGTSATYHPSTTEAATDDVSDNLLAETATGAYTVGNSDNIYVLSRNNNNEPGFYKAHSGVTIGQYKAYLSIGSVSNSPAAFMFDGQITGISKIEQNDADGVSYTVGGVRVENPTASGLYIKKGKKYMVK